MYKTRVEVNSDGEFYIVIPDDVVDEYNLSEGDLVEWDTDDEDFIILSFN